MSPRVSRSVMGGSLYHTGPSLIYNYWSDRFEHDGFCCLMKGVAEKSF